MRNRLVIDILGTEKGRSYGFQEFILNLLNYFYTHRNEILFREIVVLCNKGEEDMFGKYSDKFTILEYNCSTYLLRFWHQTLFPISLDLNSDDLLLSPGNFCGLIKRCPTILVIHDLLFKRKKWFKHNLMRIQRTFYIPISVKYADKIIAISNFTANDIKKYYPLGKDKIITVYNFFNFRKFQEEPIKEEGDYFLSVSSNEYHKNLVTVIRAFKIYKQNGGDKKLVLIGNLSKTSPAGQEYESLPSSIKEYIFIKSHVSNKELGKIYSHASCYISASLFEGLGMPIVEAMYYNLPVLLTDDTVFREVSLGLGEYFDPRNADELAIKMDSINCKKRSYSEKIITFYSEQNTSGKYVELINGLACN